MTTDAIDRLMLLIAERLRNDAEWRDAFRTVAEQMLADVTGAVLPSAEAAPPDDGRLAETAPVTPPGMPVRVEPALVGSSPVVVDLPPLTFSSARADAAALPSIDVPTAAPAFDLKLLADRFAVKREGCEWHIERRRLKQQHDVDFDDVIGPRDREVMDRARALPGGCWMWMCRPETPTPEPQLMDQAARAYDNLAHAVLLTREIIEDEKLVNRHEEAALGLLAEALSATRVVLEQIDAPLDRDHKLAFEWLRERTSTRGIFIQRHMKIDDSADPVDWNDLSERLNATRQRIRSTQATQQQQTQRLNTIRYHCQKLATSADGEAAGHWAKIVSACTDLVHANVPPSNTQLRDHLVPVIDSLPGDQPSTAEFDQVLRSVDTYLASRESEGTDAPAAMPTADVARVRAALQGKSIVMIGGESRPAARERLKADLGLNEVYWPDTRVHESHYHYEALVRRADVAVVLLAIRWANHGFGEIKAFCDAADKPMVRLPAGYHPHAVAHEIIHQAGRRLGVAGV